MSNTATEIAIFIPAKYRKTLYAILGIVGVVLTATTAGFAAAALAIPKWLIAAQAVYGVLAPVGHFVANRNVPSESPEDAI